MGLFDLFRRKKGLDLSGFDEVGNVVLFGRFPQASADYDPIPWIVVESDGESSLLLSVPTLFFSRFKNEYDTFLTWQRCDLNRRLNDTFFGQAFNEEESLRIENTEVVEESRENPDRIRNTCWSQVYIPSESELRRWFGNELPKAVATPFAGTQLALESDLAGKDVVERADTWWLRTLDYNFDHAVCVVDGNSIYSKSSFEYYGVRPLIRVNILEE